MNKKYISRILILVLTLAIAFPGAAFAADEANEDTIPADAPAAELEDETAEGSSEDTEQITAEPAGLNEETTEEMAQEAAGDFSGKTAEPADAEAPADQTEEGTGAPAEAALLAGLTAEENPTGTVGLTWEAFEGAAYYEASSPQINDGEAVRTEECVHEFSGLDHGRNYDFIVAAYDENGAALAQSVVSITTVAYKIKFKEAKYRTIKNKVIRPKKIRINLRKKIKERSRGYAIVQGGCTDGTYAYYLMVSSATQHGRVLKVQVNGNKVVKRSKILNTWHGNGMAYDSKRKKLVVIAREHRKHEITIIDANTLKISRQENVKYNFNIDAGRKDLSARYKKSGLAAIAYVKKYDCYIALERNHHNLLVFNPDTFECIGLAYTNLESNYPGTFQAMDADEKYVYLLLSYYNSRQPYNLIVAIDWNSENLLPVVNASKSKDLHYVPKYWYCNNKLNGKADAAIRIKTKHEAENIYHTTDKNGREHFYMSEYYGRMVYKKVKKKRKSYYKRDNYVYDLGII